MKPSHEQNQIRILIVDDHLIVRAGLTTLLGKEPGFQVAAGVNSGSEALAFLEKNSIDVVLLDLRMPQRSGLDVLPEIVTGRNPANVLILSSFEYEEEIYRSAKAGARGYLTKDATRAEIIAAIRRVAAGHLHFPEAIAARLAERALRIGLSPREKDILEMISKGLTNKEIGNALRISQFTVRNHVIHILGKLEATDRTEAVSIAMQQGILNAMA
ncbi:MAG: response regulator transcription factor [Terracidiphilus sp.]